MSADTDKKAEQERIKQKARELWCMDNDISPEVRDTFTRQWVAKREAYAEVLEAYALRMLSLHDANREVSERLTHGYDIEVDPIKLSNVERLAKVGMELQLLALVLDEPQDSPRLLDYAEVLLQQTFAPSPSRNSK